MFIPNIEFKPTKVYIGAAGTLRKEVRNEARSSSVARSFVLAGHLAIIIIIIIIDVIGP